MSSKSIMESDEGVSSIPTSGFEYEVFLSFRGPDTRSTFTDHLYVRLVDAGIRAFRDDEELRKGEKIGTELLKAIKESKIAIPIFSKGYAASKWCLEELAQIVECKRSNSLKVMPIFYDVTPSEVRHQNENYAKAFESYGKCYDEDTIKRWKAALTEVGGLSGWDNHSSTGRNITFRKLAILNVSCQNVKSSWSGWSHIKMAKNLKVLNLSQCGNLDKTPDLSCHLLLEQLILRGCGALVEIDKSISMLQHLVILNLSNCRCLKKLPEELNRMESLEELDISFSGIVEIPNWSLMTRLRVFDCNWCYELRKVSSLDFAVNITELSFQESQITILPESIGKLLNLLKLSLQNCKGIKTLPESIGDLVSLVELNLYGSGIVELPNTILNLRNLKTLSISHTPLRRLPLTIGTMENLMSINAHQCNQLQDIPKLPQSLISLEVSGVRTSRIPDLSNLINLKHLHLHLDDEPVDLLEAGSSALWWIGRFTNLETLKLTSKCIISFHEDLGMLSHLTTLELFSCTKLQSVSKLPLGLINLKIGECTSLRTLMDLPSSLKNLHVYNCSSLEIDHSHLKKLICSHELEKLGLCGCVFFEIDDLNMLENLATLYIKGCMNLRSLPDLSSLKKLEELQGCSRGKCWLLSLDSNESSC